MFFFLCSWYLCTFRHCTGTVGKTSYCFGLSRVSSVFSDGNSCYRDVFRKLRLPIQCQILSIRLLFTQLWTRCQISATTKCILVTLLNVSNRFIHIITSFVLYVVKLHLWYQTFYVTLKVIKFILFVAVFICRYNNHRTRYKRLHRKTVLHDLKNNA